VQVEGEGDAIEVEQINTIVDRITSDLAQPLSSA
jgi:hypothetical protein